MQKKIEIFISDDMYGNSVGALGPQDDVFEFLNSLNEDNKYKLSHITNALRARYKIDIIVTDMEATKAQMQLKEQHYVQESVSVTACAIRQPYGR